MEMTLESNILFYYIQSLINIFEFPPTRTERMRDSTPKQKVKKDIRKIYWIS